MPLFNDLVKRLDAAIKTGDGVEQTAVLDRLGLELDRVDREQKAKQAATGAKPVTNILITNTGSSGGGGADNSPDQPDREKFTTVASEDGILVGHVVTIRILGNGGTEAYLATAANTERRADAVVVDTQFVAGVRRLVCTTHGKHNIRMATAALPTVDTRLFLSAVTAGTLTDNPSESSSRLFEQEIGLYLQPSKNALGAVQLGRALVDVQLSSRPSSFSFGSTI